MNKVQPFLLRGFVVPALALLAACSGAKVDEGSTNGAGTAAATPRGKDAPATQLAADRATGQPVQGTQGQDPQGQGELAAQRQKVFIDTTLKEARRMLDLKLFEDARRLAAQALEVEPANRDAREILVTADDLLGKNANRTTSQRFEDLLAQGRVLEERDRFAAENAMRVGDAHITAGRFDEAIESFRRGQLILRYSPAIQQGSPLEKEIDQRLADAVKAKQKADQDRDEARRVASRRELDEAERQKRVNTEAKVRRLFEESNSAFQHGNYQRSVTLLEEVIKLQPSNGNALALHDLAERARHENAIETLRQQWKEDWSRTFDELQASDIPQTDTIKFDPIRWAQVAMRKPLQFTTEDTDSPEEKAILEKLKTTRLEHRFAKADLEAWAAYYANVTEVTFVVTKGVQELDAAQTTLTDFVLPASYSVYQALNVISAQTSVKWKIQNGMVQLVTADKAGGKMTLKPYEVRDLVQGVKDRPGRDLKLAIPGEAETPPAEEEEAKPTVVDENKLMDTIRATIEPESWTGGEATMTPHKGVLMVRHTKETHEKIEKFLRDLRLAVGIQVDVDARFIKVQDNFLEDVGIDFRGLGNQASEGINGRGLEKNNRSNAGFDDFGQRQNTNTATPGTIGTGTEPGAFYDDGGDGDFMGRVENLFNRTLGGREGGLDNAGGLSVQYAYLNDIQLEVILRAVSKQERSEEITAPRLLVYNNKRAHMQVLRATSYIKDFDVEIAQAAAVANPVIDVVRDGVVLDVRPVVAADRKFITMELRPTVLSLQLPIPTFTTTLGVGQPISIQLPRVTRQTVRTTVTLPDGGTILLGGMSLAEKQDEVSGVPILKDLPILSFLFSRKGTSTQNQRIVILMRARIVLPAEHEPKEMPADAASMIGGGSR